MKFNYEEFNKQYEAGKAKSNVKPGTDPVPAPVTTPDVDPIEAFSQQLTSKKAAENQQSKYAIQRGFSQGVDTLQGSLHGAVGLTGSLFKNKGLRDWGYRGYLRNMNESAENPTLSLFKDVKDVESGFEWAMGGIGTLLPSMIEAGVGAAIGSFIAPGPGTAVGAFSTRTLLRKGIGEATEKIIKDQVRRGLVKEGMEKTASSEVKRMMTQGVLKKLGGRSAIEGAVGKQAMKKLGGKIGMGAAVFPMEAGGNYGELLSSHGIDAPETALFFGALATAIEYLGGNSRLIDTFIDAVAKGSPGIIKKTAKELLRNMPEEALQEAGQETLSILNTVVNTDEEFLTVENIERIIEAGALGSLGGGVGAGGHVALSSIFGGKESSDDDTSDGPGDGPDGPGDGPTKVEDVDINKGAFRSILDGLNSGAIPTEDAIDLVQTGYESGVFVDQDLESFKQEHPGLGIAIDKILRPDEISVSGLVTSAERTIYDKLGFSEEQISRMTPEAVDSIIESDLDLSTPEERQAAIELSAVAEEGRARTEAEVEDFRSDVEIAEEEELKKLGPSVDPARQAEEVEILKKRNDPVEPAAAVEPEEITDKERQKTRTQELFDTLSEGDQQFALKIPEGKERDKFVKRWAYDNADGAKLTERHAAEDVVRDPGDAPIEDRVTARLLVESGEGVYNTAEASDVLKIIKKEGMDQMAPGKHRAGWHDYEHAIKEAYDIERGLIDSTKKTEPSPKELDAVDPDSFDLTTPEGRQSAINASAGIDADQANREKNQREIYTWTPEKLEKVSNRERIALAEKVGVSEETIDNGTTEEINSEILSKSAGQEKAARDKIDPVMAETLTTMRDEALASETKGVSADEEGKVIGFAASSPAWMKNLNKKMKDIKEPLFSRKELDNLITKYTEGKELTVKQHDRFRHILDSAEEVKDTDPGTVMQQDMEEFEKKGFEPMGGQEVTAADLNKGDKFIGTVDGVKDEYTVTGETKDGDTILQDGVRREVDPFDTIEIDAIKRVSPVKKKSVKDMTKEEPKKPGEQSELFKEEPKLFDEPETPKPKKKREKKVKGKSNLEQQNLFGMNQENLFEDAPEKSDGKIPLTTFNNVSDAVGWIAANSKNESYRKIAEKIQSFIGDVKLIVVEAGVEVEGGVPTRLNVALGIHVRAKGGGETIYLKGESFKENGMSEETILHEALHAATANRIDEGNLAKNKDIKLAKAVKDLYALQNHVAAELKKRLKNKTATEFEKSMKTIFNASSVDELVANGLTSPEFQKMLKSIKYEQKETGWSKFVDILSRVLGLKGNTALDEIIRNTSEILSAERPAAPKNSEEAILHSIQDSKKDLTALHNTTAFKKWSGGNEIISDHEIADAKPNKGYTFKVYHGTTHDFEAFDPSVTGNIEGAFGAVNYFTSDKGDADINYAGEGPDLTNRIEQLVDRLDGADAELIAEELDIDFDTAETVVDNDTAIRQLATEKLSGGEPQTLDVYVKSDNPAFVGGDTTTWIENFEEIDQSGLDDAWAEIKEENDAEESEREDYEGEIEDRVREQQYDQAPEIVSAVNEAIWATGNEPGEVLSGLDEILYESEVSATQLEDALRKNEELSYMEDSETGELVQSKVIGDVFKNLGFDSIVLQNAGERFKGMDMGTETSHVHVFEETPENIKSVDNRGTFSLEDKRFRFQRKPAAKGLPVSDVKKHISGILGKARNAPDTVFVQSESELPNAIQTEITKNNAEGEISGVWYDGKVYFVADNIADNKAAESAVLHELFGHAGVESILPETSTRKFFSSVHTAKSGTEEYKAVVTDYGLDMSKARDRVTAAREYVARVAESGVDDSIITQLIGMVRTALRKLGIGLKVSDGDIKRLIAAGSRDIRGEASGVVISKEGQPLFQITPPVGKWFSQMENFLVDKLPGKGSPKQIAQTVNSWAKKGMIKSEELEWSGLTEWLQEQEGKVTKQQILDYLAENNVVVEEVVRGGVKPLEWKDAGKSAKYTVSSNPNLKIEHLPNGYFTLHAPGGIRDLFRKLSKAKQAAEKMHGYIAEPDTKHSSQTIPGIKDYKEIVLWTEKAEPMTEDATHFVEGHEGKRQIAWIRFGTRMVGEQKILHIEEIQSKRHQEGREKGYVPQEVEIRQNAPKTQWQILVGGEIVLAAYETKAEAEADINHPNVVQAVNQGVPDAPFKQSKVWGLLAIKRMVRYAAENGFDGIAITPGQIQADRYDLSKQVDSVSAARVESGAYSIDVTKDGNLVTQKTLGHNELDDFIGKDLADKIRSNDDVQQGFVTTFAGQDLKVGGEGMKGFYDKILPSVVNKFFNKKPWGKARVGTIDIETEGQERVVDEDFYDEDPIELTREEAVQHLRDGHEISGFHTEAGAGDTIYAGHEHTLDEYDYFYMEPWQAEEAGLMGRTRPTGETKTVTVHHLPITDEMRAKALTEGMPLFQRKTDTPLIKEARKYDNVEEFNARGFEVIQKELFGITNDDVVTVPIEKVEIKWHDDLENAKDTAKKEYDAKTAEPVDFIFDIKTEKFILDDGHNRYVAAKRSGSPLRGIVNYTKGNMEELAQIYEQRTGETLTDTWNKAHLTNKDAPLFQRKKDESQKNIEDIKARLAEAGTKEEKAALFQELISAKAAPVPVTEPGVPTAVVPETDYEQNRKESKSVALTTLTSMTRVKKEIKQGIDKYLGAISTRLANINPKLKSKLRKLSYDTDTKSKTDVLKVEPLLRKAKSEMTTDDIKDWDYARKNSDVAKINELVSKYDMGKEYKAYRGALDSLRKEALDVGLDVGYIEEYAPRVLKDPKGFLEAIGKEGDWDNISRRLRERAEEMGMTVAGMSPDQKADLITNMLLGGYAGLGGVSATKHRKLKKIPAHLNKFYMDSDAALMAHIYSMRKAIEARKFFGKVPDIIAEAKRRLNAANKRIIELQKADEPDFDKIRMVQDNIREYGKRIEKYKHQRDYTDNISTYIMELLAKGEVKESQEQELIDILTARFHERGTRGIIQAYKNLSYIDTMGSVTSALTQIGDLAWSAYDAGMIPTLRNASKALVGKSRITKEDVGIQRIAQEFQDSGTLGNAVSTVFKMVGLEKMDSIGKESLLNSAFEKYQKEAKNNPVKLKKQIEDIFEGETDGVIQDLLNDDITENVKLLVYNRLLDFQPVALSEMPQKYLDAGNGRLFYMLKSFTLKQFDVYRNEVFQKIKSKDKATKLEGLKNLVRLSFFFVLANAGADELKDLVLGRKTDLEDRVTDNILRLFGVSKFVTWKARTEGIGSAAVKQILFPVKFIDAITRDVVTAGDEKGLQALASVPIVGKLAYWHIGRGTHKRDDLWDRRLRKKKRKFTKVKEDLEKAKNKAEFRKAHKEEFAEIRKLKALQKRLNRYRKRINRLKSKAESKENKKKISELEEKRTDLIIVYMK